VSAKAATVFGDLEVVELLRDEPELLAIADAVTATQAARHPSLRLRRLLIAAAALAAALAVALAGPWEHGRSGIVDLALAAIGTGQVIHVVVRGESRDPRLVELATGRETPTPIETEIWFDERRGLEREITRMNGRVMDEELRTPTGAWTREGRVFTCAWIAAHPLEATSRRVSCNLDGKNGTTPRRVPEERPTLDPALSGFVTHYQDALRSGRARSIGAGTVRGRAVEWLEFQLPSQVERVAVDRETGRPLLLRALAGGEVVASSTVSTAETLAPSKASFPIPRRLPPEQRPAVGNVVESRPVPIGAAAAAVDGLLWLGRTFGGLPLRDVQLQMLETGYGPDSKKTPTRGEGVQLVYGERPGTPLRAGAAYVWIRESDGPELAYGFVGQTIRPPPGYLLLREVQVLTAPPQGGTAVPSGVVLWDGQLVRGRLHLALEATSKELLLAAARSLVPARGAR
jgi:hypothetical protein